MLRRSLLVHSSSSRNANETLREYVTFEYSAKPADVTAIMQAIALLEVTWSEPADGGQRNSKPLTAQVRERKHLTFLKFLI